MNTRITARNSSMELCKSCQRINVLDHCNDQGIQLCSHTHIRLLRQCTVNQSLVVGKLVHAHIIKTQVDTIPVSNMIINMYARCGSILDARQIFIQMPEYNMYTWTIIITCYSMRGDGSEAINLFGQMQQKGYKAGQVTYLSVLNACARTKKLRFGKNIHAHLIKAGFEAENFIGNTLVFMYAKCGSIEDARIVFNKMPLQDLISWNAIISGYAQHGHGKEVIQLFSQMLQHKVKPDRVTYICILTSDANTIAIHHGKYMHAHLLKAGTNFDVTVASTIVRMYARCGSIEDAHTLFRNMPEKDVVSWTIVISAYAQLGNGKLAIKLFYDMQKHGLEPDKVMYVTICSSCADFQYGRYIHCFIIKTPLEHDIHIQNSLISMYTKCECMHSARMLFDRMAGRDVLSWNALISGYVRQGSAEKAINLFSQMQHCETRPDEATFIVLLSACSFSGAIGHGKHIHSHVVKAGLVSGTLVANTLVSMYCRYARFEDAHHVFNRILRQDIISWNAIISGYLECENTKDILNFFSLLKCQQLVPDNVTYISALSGCASAEDLARGKFLHVMLLNFGMDFDTTAANALTGMYSLCGSLMDACRVFDRISVKDVSSWNTMVAAYANCLEGKEAFKTFHQMQEEGCIPDSGTCISMVIACANLGSLQHGRYMHAYIINAGFDLEVFISSILVEMYAETGSMGDAIQTFGKAVVQDIISWTSIIKIFCQHGDGREAIKLFQEMLQHGLKPDGVTSICILCACVSAGALGWGKHAHAHVIASGVHLDTYMASALVTMYSKSGNFNDASQVFNAIAFPDLVLWNAYISGHAEYGDVFELCKTMQGQGFTPDKVTYLSIFTSCTTKGALDLGKSVHNALEKAGLDLDNDIQNRLIVMYMKCGSMKDAQHVFENMRSRDFVSWNAMVLGYAQHGNANEVSSFVQKMQEESIHISQLAFISILTAYSYVGLADEGCHYFTIINALYMNRITMSHYAWLIDLFSRAGHLHEANNLIEQMPFEPDQVVWTVFLGSCRIYGAVDLAAAEAILTYS